jgi:hypothetical protein
VTSQSKGNWATGQTLGNFVQVKDAGHQVDRQWVRAYSQGPSLPALRLDVLLRRSDIGDF